VKGLLGRLLIITPIQILFSMATISRGVELGSWGWWAVMFGVGAMISIGIDLIKD